MLDAFKQHITHHHLFSPKDKLLLAVSGGVDSVVLCELCHRAGYSFVIAHCNFQLRGEESDRDEGFVKGLGKKYNVTVLTRKFDTQKYAGEKKISIQEAARELRYAWFDELLNTPGEPTPAYASLLTAHHADDNIETLLMHFFRGTGLPGLTGIPAVNGKFRRPLLPFFKEQLLDFAKASKLDWVEDSSNESSKYTRNFFRNELIPAIANVYPQVKHNLQHTIERFGEIEKLYRLTVEELKKKLVRQKGAEYHIPVKQLLQYDNRALVYEIIAPFGFTEKQVDEVYKLATSESGKYLQSPSNAYRILKHRHWFIITPVMATGSTHYLLEQGTEKLDFGSGRLKIEVQGSPGASGLAMKNPPSIATLDLQRLEFPLLLRPWKTGDYFYPLGMKKKKKLSRFFIDQKFSKTEKERTWVLESGQRIAWVVGHRIDERFRITPATKEVVQIQLTPAQ